jgi:transaldolase
VGTHIDGLTVKIFADGADRAGILDLARNPLIKGFTTNPTLMRQAGITHYEAFARAILEEVPDRPFSLEVFSDDFDEMAEQARRIASWGQNVYVKIPVTNTKGESSSKLIRALAEDGTKLNVTAMMTMAQVRWVAESLQGSPSSYASVFAGRIADAGRDPVPLMAAAVELLAAYPGLELIWASPREVLNILQADAVGCHIITVTHDLLKKLGNVGRDLDDFSLATVRMFFDDATAAGYQL